MPKILSQLKTLWNKEKKHYQFQEVGSGVQKFVKEILSSPDLFNLSECPLSKKRENRKMEFIHEKKTKDRRRADFVIYINMDIVIPIEVESFGKIEVGAKQLAQYQEDLEKKYGILTDGYLWRFYTDNVYREFTIDEIFKNRELFLEYWREYIKPESYYLQFFEDKGQLKLLKEEKLPVENYRPLFFNNITELIRKLGNKLRLEGYFNGVSNKEKKKKAVEITYAYIIQFILYKTLVDNDFGGFGKEYEKKVNQIYQCLKDKHYTKILGIIGGISKEISKNVYKPFNEEQEFINAKLWQLFYQTENSLSDVSPWLDIFIFIKKFSFANVRNEIFGFIYENYLKELFEDTKKGQYFTDPEVVNFMIKQIGYSPENLKEKVKNKQLDKLSIVDPSCGSGTFLYSAVNEIIEAIPNGSEDASKLIEDIVVNNIFGLDIEEFPLYLAEMNIIMRMLPLIINEKFNNPIDKKIKVFKTMDSVAEFMDTALRNTVNDADVECARNNGQMSLFTKELGLGYSSYVRDEDDLKEMKRSLENNKIPRRRFDYVIGNPPYVSYNECSKQGIKVFDWIKKGEVKLNNIYGVNLHSVPDHRKKYPPKPNLYAFFIALGLILLKDNGKLCYIIPQTILTAGDLDVIRYHLAKFATIEKIITFSGKMFVSRGLKQKHEVATSSLVLVVRRRRPADINQVEIINYNNANDSVQDALKNILQGKRIKKKKIKQDDLLTSFVNWNFIKQDKKFLDFYKEYKKNSEDISIYYNHDLAEYYFKNRFYFDIGFSLKQKEVLKNNSDGKCYELLDFKNFYDYSRFIPTTYYPKTKAKIKLTKNSQGYITLKQKHKIVWSVKNPKRFHFTERNIVFNMGKASIICSNNKPEIFYLFALLNSGINKIVLENNLKQEHEQSYFVAISGIKQFVRVPKITEYNQHIKNEIIKQTEKMLKLEQIKLSDLVDFHRGASMQKFDDAKVEKNNLVLIKNGKAVKLKIKKSADLINKTISNLVGDDKLLLEKKKIILNKLKELPIIDFELRDKIKDYIDDLVFVLYFNVSIGDIGFKRDKAIRGKCKKI